MDTYHFINRLRIYRRTNTVQRNILNGNCKRRSTYSKLYIYDSIFFHCANDVSDGNWIASCGERKQFACHFVFFTIFIYEYQAVNRNRAFITDMHNTNPPLIILPYKFNGVNIDTTPSYSYNVPYDVVLFFTSKEEPA